MTSLRVVTGHPFVIITVLDPATKAICQTTSGGQLTITYARRSFWQIYWPVECLYRAAYYT